MIYGIALLLIFQLAGEFLTKFLHLPLPGPVTGMLILFFALCFSPYLYSRVSKAAHFLLKNMALFFVPAGVGVISIWSKIQSQWPALFCILLVSTLMTMGVSSVLFHHLKRRQKE